MSHKVVCQKWIEEEFGFNITRPNGYTLHLNMDHRNDYVQKNDEEIKQKGEPKDGDEFSVTIGEPYYCYVEDDVYQDIVNNILKKGIWRFSGKAPESI
jgi:hypothetical protein